MKKTLNFVKRNSFGFLLGIIFCSITIVLAESINSNEVLYDNSNSKTSYDNVQDVLDDLYDIYDHSSLGFSLLTHTPTGLSTELIAGLYRFQGVQDTYNNVNNYICFGTNNKSTCTSDTDKYMYRIIGVNTGGQLKLIKKEALNTAYQWNSTNDNISWVDSDLYAGLNGNYFLTNTTYVPDSTWSNKIANTVWHYGAVSGYNNVASVVATTEMNLSNTISSKIGLVYIHDYYYGLTGDNNCERNYGACKNSWIHLSKNDTGAPTGNEWLIQKYNNNSALRIVSNGYMTEASSPSSSLTTSYSVRPVFYINASETIASGSGTIDDPYMLS